MRTTTAALGLLAPAAALALPLTVGMAATASADTPTVYQAILNPLNDSGAAGQFMMKVDGDQAQISEHVWGLAPTFQGGAYPHVQHIHIGGQGTCPAPSADANGDGIVDTAEGKDAYGAVNTTLSTTGDTSAKAATDVTTAPGGGEFEYSRTITLSPATLSALHDGTAVVVVHGLDPAGLSEQAANAKSNLAPELPLAATAPAVCGAVTASQMSAMPSGGVDTGGGASAGIEDAWVFGVGGASLLAAGGALAVTRRRGAADAPRK
ncbi:hypothetical protein [Tomitella cavernea]|uniref:CHRD domain-containing protein n=1 Tax=Tomitella cavernea TaxID=1387982 RepID=A0ABP9D7G4_9ACTN|nr:hypothetical protein [Tomitella cavernea]